MNAVNESVGQETMSSLRCKKEKEVAGSEEVALPITMPDVDPEQRYATGEKGQKKPILNPKHAQYQIKDFTAASVTKEKETQSFTCHLLMVIVSSGLPKNFPKNR